MTECSETAIADAVAAEFIKKPEQRKQTVEDELEDARLRAVERVLFADEKQLKVEVARISNLKARF